MKYKKLHHVGIVVDDLDSGIERFTGFGFSCKAVRELKDAGVKIAFFPVGESLIELLCFDPDKRQTISEGAQKNAINHICFEVENLDAAIQDFQKNGATLMEGFPRAVGRSRMAFFLPETTSNVLIEVMQE
jgi:methylmalonyl-CoA/ethylmalonyl-CoA epimerase